MQQKFRSKEVLGVVLQKETLGLHEIYTCRLLIGLEFLVGWNKFAKRGDTVYSKNYMYYTSFNMNYNTDDVCCSFN